MMARILTGQKVEVVASDYGTTSLGIHQALVEIYVDDKVVETITLVGLETYEPLQVDFIRRNRTK
jgi:hypothetical protein